MSRWQAEDETDAKRDAVAGAVDHEPRAVKVDELIIDEDTGEVLELPENAGDKTEFLTYRLVTLQEAERAYKQAIFLLKLALKKELEGLDLKFLQTQYGRPVIRSRTTRTGKVERIQEVKESFELSVAQVNHILDAASSLDAKYLDDLAAVGTVPREAIEALIEETHSEWLQVSPVLKEPPVVEKVK